MLYFSKLRIFKWVADPADAVFDTVDCNLFPALCDEIAPDGDESSGNLKFIGVAGNDHADTSLFRGLYRHLPIRPHRA